MLNGVLASETIALKYDKVLKHTVFVLYIKKVHSMLPSAVSKKINVL